MLLTYVYLSFTQDVSQGCSNLRPDTARRITKLMSGQGPDVAPHQAHSGGLQGAWDQHAVLRLPKMHELPPLDTQLIPASLARAFGIQLTDGADEDNQAGPQQEPGPQGEVPQTSEQMLQQAQQQSMQQAQYAGYPYAMNALDGQAYTQQFPGFQQHAGQGFNPMLMSGMQPGNAGFGAYMPAGMFDPRDAMAASYGLGQFQGSHAARKRFARLL